MKPLKTYFTFAFLFCMVFSMHAQHLLTDTTNIKYFEATSELNADWNTLNFNDKEWKKVTGMNIFGYGEPYFDGEEQNVVKTEEATSLYFRTFFNIDDKETVKAFNFFCDYDDGFVAYINGVEFARVNMGLQGSPTTFNQTADRSHEMEITRRNMFPVCGHYIDSNFINTTIAEGQNVLAVEVHNDSLTGSDLSFYGVLVDVSQTQYDLYSDFHRYKKDVEFKASKLPVIVIETDEYGIPYLKEDGKWVEVPATMGIINNGNNKENKLTDKYEHFGAIEIQYRGQSSSDFPKRPYAFELKDEEGKDTSISLLGMPREEDWILQGPFADKSQIRNALFYKLGLKTGRWTPRVEFCELIINGQYVGLYNLIEKIKRDSNRISIGKLKPEEITGTDLTGGYILKYDKPGTLQIVYPKKDNLQPEQKAYIKNYIKTYEDVLYSNDGLDDQNGYSKYIDEQSLIDYIIIAELGKNCDSYLFSTYFFKNKDDRDPRLKFGPIWDFDLCMGNSVWQDGDQTYDWQFAYRANKRFHIERLLEDRAFVDQLNDRYAELRQDYLHKDSLFNLIDELVEKLAEPIQRNYEIWPLIDQPIFFEAYKVSSYEEEINYIKDWLSRRLAWLDENMPKIYYPVKDYSGLDISENSISKGFATNVYPNPVANDLFIDLNLDKGGKLEVVLINTQGKTVTIIENSSIETGKYKLYWQRDQSMVHSGLHILSIKLNGKTQSHTKVLFQ